MSEKEKAHEERLEKFVKSQLKQAMESKKRRKERNDVNVALFGKPKEEEAESSVFTDADFEASSRH